MTFDATGSGAYQVIPANALYKDYKAELELYVNRLDISEAWSLTEGFYPTDTSFRNQLKAWVKSIWLSAKNNAKWTQENVRIQAAKNGVTYNQQIVKDACWQMGQAEKSKISLTDLNGAEHLRAESTRRDIEDAFNRLNQSVDSL